MVPTIQPTRIPTDMHDPTVKSMYEHGEYGIAAAIYVALLIGSLYLTGQGKPFSITFTSTGGKHDSYNNIGLKGVSSLREWSSDGGAWSSSARARGTYEERNADTLSIVKDMIEISTLGSPHLPCIYP